MGHLGETDRTESRGYLGSLALRGREETEVSLGQEELWDSRARQASEGSPALRERMDHPDQEESRASRVRKVRLDWLAVQARPALRDLPGTRGVEESQASWELRARLVNREREESRA